VVKEECVQRAPALTLKRSLRVLEFSSTKNEKQRAATTLSLAMSPQGTLYLDYLGGGSEESGIFNEKSRNRIKEGFEIS
jgi:hypothetical protein